MSLNNLISFNKPSALQVKKRGYDPFFSLQSEINRLFNEDFMPTSAKEYSSLIPNIDVVENDKQIIVKAELAGLAEDDIDIEVTEKSLSIKGEKKDEHQEKGDSYIIKESSYGSFSRSFTLPENVDGNKADAKFKKGVLTITIPKKELPENKVKKLKVKSDD
ncbi:MAG: Hsp20/alpha crystallin family protein [Rickettsiales bacterium]|nr:Hsp20/alpha crystallin family protein [Pseudomonadota bacterium]MDA0965443.1 Hsp20/alpha crystallin family protein [Pseudomonadota bacterium]MDG4542768.1 Hsp20/alpha crystallin family protein [Rickettsiales bacterium]MDG4544784.1 Hsp20/alpha crystallin family protein [Rickettsiales bacterium]MDG4546906.1 Hsp20/alpha crystallin family protein [Rickettsiales bacterium]